VTPAAVNTPAPGAATPALTAEELAVCRMFGTTPTAFAAAKTKLQEH
jgi:phage I-like protein